MILEREGGREQGRERGENMDVREKHDRLPFLHAPTGDGTLSLGVRPEQRWNPQPFGVRDNAPVS